MIVRRPRILALALLFGVTALLASATFNRVAAAPRQVTLKLVHAKIITDASAVGAYSPKTIVVHLGDRITFRNSSNAPHTITVDHGHAFDSGNIAIGKSWTFTVKHIGSFPYHCSYHALMHGKIVVKR